MLQQDDYYPFGMEILRGTITSPKNEYLYNKKELQEELGEYDYGRRYYDPIIGRWTTIDPMAEMGRRETPYGYAFDDPMRFTDPDGMWPDEGGSPDLIQPTGNVFRHENPILATTHDIAYFILDHTGIKDLVNSIGHAGDKNVSTKDKVGHIVQAAANIISLGEDGESEGFHGEGPKLEPNKNSNDYVGHQGVYEIKKDGDLQKYGKADMTKTSTTTGQPTRLQSQLNKLQKENPNSIVEGEVIHDNKKISTKDIKKVETQKVQEYYDKNNKKYPPGNQNHPGVY